MIRLLLIQMGCQVSGGVLTHDPKRKYPTALLCELGNSGSNPETNKELKMMKTYSSQQSKLNDSIAFYSHMIERNPRVYDPFDALGNPEDEVGYHEGNVQKWYQQNRQKGLITGNPFDSLSLCYSLKKDVTSARIWYEQILSRHPQSLELSFGLANIYYKLGLFQESQKVYRKCIDLNPRFDKAYQCIANIYCFKLYDNSQAEEWARFTLKINPKNVYASLILAIVDQEPKRRLKTLLKLNQSHPKYTRIQNTIGVTYLENQLIDSAIIWFENGFKINPKYYALACGLGIAYNRKFKYDEAIKWSLIAHQLNERHPQPCLNLGDAFKGKGEIESAKIWYQRCIEANPEYQDPYFKLASLYEESDREKAIGFIQQGLQKNDRNTQGLYALGKLYAQGKIYVKAIEVLEQLNAIDPEHLQCLFLLGRLYQLTGKSQQSFKYLVSVVSKSNKKQQIKERVIRFYNENGLITKIKQFHKKLLISKNQ